MTLYEQFEDIIPDESVSQELVIECTDKVYDIATDFLQWYIEENIDPYTEHRSINDLWGQFKIERNL